MEANPRELLIKHKTRCYQLFSEVKGANAVLFELLEVDAVL